MTIPGITNSGGTYPVILDVLTNGVLLTRISYNNAVVAAVSNIFDINLPPGTYNLTFRLTDSVGATSSFIYPTPIVVVEPAADLVDAKPVNNPLGCSTPLEIAGVPPGSTVRVYNFRGREIEHEFMAGQDGVARSPIITGCNLAPGIYIAVVKSPDGQSRKRIKLVVTGE